MFVVDGLDIATDDRHSKYRRRTRGLDGYGGWAIRLSKCAHTKCDSDWYKKLDLHSNLLIDGRVLPDCVIGCVGGLMFPERSPVGWSSLSKVDIGKRMEQPGDIQDPQNHGNDDNAVEN